MSPRHYRRQVLRAAEAAQVSVAVGVRRYIVIPKRPEGTEGWREERLRDLVTRDSMVGVTTAKGPGSVA